MKPFKLANSLRKSKIKKTPKMWQNLTQSNIIKHLLRKDLKTYFSYNSLNTIHN